MEPLGTKLRAFSFSDAWQAATWAFYLPGVRSKGGDERFGATYPKATGATAPSKEPSLKLLLVTLSRMAHHLPLTHQSLRPCGALRGRKQCPR